MLVRSLGLFMIEDLPIELFTCGLINLKGSPRPCLNMVKRDFCCLNKQDVLRILGMRSVGGNFFLLVWSTQNVREAFGLMKW